MIVFASHDNINLLQLNLSRLCELDLNGHDVLIVDTCSKDNRYIREFHRLKKQYPQFRFIRKEYSSWDTGAYLHAYKHYDASRYIFLQDSLYMSSNTFIKDIDALLDEYDVVPMFDHYYTYDSEADKQWVEDGLPVTSRPDYLFFGPLFATHRSVLDKIPKEWHREPNDKLTSTRMERRWALMFHLIGATCKYYNKTNYGHFWQKFPCTQHRIRKVWMTRPA